MPDTSPQHKPKTRRTKDFDLAVLGQLDYVSLPKQARSERSLQRVLAALESLLEKRSFAEISIPEIAARSRCSAATIYGRFKDKHSILAALHESLRVPLVAELEQLLDPHRWIDRDLEQLSEEFCTKLVGFYRRDWNLMTAVLVSGDPEVFQRANQNIQHTIDCFGDAVRRLRGGDIGVVEGRVGMGVRAVFALVQQRLLFGSAVSGSNAEHTDPPFAAELAALLRICVRGTP